MNTFALTDFRRSGPWLDHSLPNAICVRDQLRREDVNSAFGSPDCFDRQTQSRRWFLLHAPSGTRLTLLAEGDDNRPGWFLRCDRDSSTAAGALLELLQPGSAFAGFSALTAAELKVLDGSESPSAVVSLRRRAADRRQAAA